MNQSFGKDYSLCSRKIIDQLFSEGEHVKSYPFILRYKFVELPKHTPFQIVTSAPKRNFKKAVDRNRIKRLMREVLRKNKAILENNIENKQLALFLMYTGREMPSYNDVEKKLLKVLLKFETEVLKEKI